MHNISKLNCFMVFSVMSTSVVRRSLGLENERVPRRSPGCWECRLFTIKLPTKHFIEFLFEPRKYREDKVRRNVSRAKGTVERKSTVRPKQEKKKNLLCNSWTQYSDPSSFDVLQYRSRYVPGTYRSKKWTSKDRNQHDSLFIILFTYYQGFDVIIFQLIITSTYVQYRYYRSHWNFHLLFQQ